MNFSPNEIILEAQRGRQWSPLITQQLRLRHINQIWCLNLKAENMKTGSFYFTLHLTSMSAPFYTSEKTHGPHPKWPDLTLNKYPSVSAIVLRIWRHGQENVNEDEKLILTWGLHLSGMVYIGNKVTDVQPSLYNSNTVIFYMFGGFFTCKNSLRDCVQKFPPSFLENSNLIDFPNKKLLLKRFSCLYSRSDLKKSYNVEKMRKLHYLEVMIKNKSLDVQLMQDRISELDVLLQKPEVDVPLSPTKTTSQLLTMNCLNRMLQEKPTRSQKQEMFKLNKQIEIAKFRSRLLGQEQEKKLNTVRQLQKNHSLLVESNSEKGRLCFEMSVTTENCIFMKKQDFFSALVFENRREFLLEIAATESTLMENYHTLSKEKEKLKEYQRVVAQHRELLVHSTSQLQHRKRQLLQQLLWIYPIKETSDKKYTINNIYLPNADVLSDANDDGISVALGYVTHVLTMCSTFLQVPLRYPVIHYGSRSSIIDQISANLPEREFPLYTKGKDRMQFTYGVYLLNKNIAQMRWLYFMHTPDLKLTLPNLLNFLQGYKEFKQERFMLLKSTPNSQTDLYEHFTDDSSTSKLSFIKHSGKLTPLSSYYDSCTHCSDPILDCLRHEKCAERSVSPASSSSSTKRKIRSANGDTHVCPGLGEILAIPEAFLSRQMSGDSLRNYASVSSNDKISGASKKLAKIPTDSKNTQQNCDIISTNKTSVSDKCPQLLHSDSVEEGTDLLNPKPSELCEFSVENVGKFEETHTISYCENEQDSTSSNLISKEQQEFMQNWLRTGPALVCSDKNLYPEEFLGSASTSSQHLESPLTARTDALLTTKTFNLVKPKH